MDIQELFDYLDREGKWKDEFSMLHFDSYEIASRLHTSSAKSEENRSKNRYVDVLPFDETRVRLKSANDYINASHVRPPFVNLNYICSQGPMLKTSMDFWQMVWDEKSSVVVMLNRIIENNRLKCHPYWPTGETDEDGDVDNIFDSIDYLVTLVSKDDYQFYAISQLELTKRDTNESRTVFHLHYYDWPDFGVPETAMKFLMFLKTVRSYYHSCEGPPVVHCSAGIGRTGTLVLVDTVLTIIEQQKTINIDIYSILIYIRQHRVGLVQTPDQLRFCFLAILKGLEDFDMTNFKKERITAELEIDLESSEGSVDYMISSEEDSEEDTDEDNGDRYKVNNIDDEVNNIDHDDDLLDEDDIIIEENDIAIVNRDSEEIFSDRSEGLSPSSIELVSTAIEEVTPETTPELLTQCESSEPDLDLSSDIIPEPENTEKEEERRKRKAKTAELVSQIKAKVTAHESNVVKKQYMWDNFGKPLLFGSAAALGLSVLIYLVR